MDNKGSPNEFVHENHSKAIRYVKAYALVVNPMSGHANWKKT